jgi:hypothetical protein
MIPSYNRTSQEYFMDDLILAGALSIAGLYLAAVLTVAAAIFTLMDLYGAAATGDYGRVVTILAIVFLIGAAYTGTGRWLQKIGRI